MSTITVPVKPASFTQAYSMLLGEAMRRHGFLGNRHYGDWSLDRRTAEDLGVPVTEPTYAPGDEIGSMDLTKGHCPDCAAALTVVNARDEQVGIWGGSLSGYEGSETYATADYVCPNGHLSTPVWIDGTLASAVTHIDAIATEWGW